MRPVPFIGTGPWRVPVVGATRLELVTSAVSRQRSNQLSYAPGTDVPLYLIGGRPGVKEKKRFRTRHPSLTTICAPGNSNRMKDQPRRTDRVSVMSLNIRFGLADTGEHGWENRKPGFAALFDQYRPDFIGMQEVNGFQAAFFSGLLSDYHAIGKRTPAPAGWQDVLIFYHKSWKCRDCDRFFLSDTPDVPSRMPDSRWPRQCVMGAFEKEGLRMVCVNTHFDFDAPVQVKSAAILLARLEKFSGPALPALLTGDFNAGPGSDCHRAFTDPDRLARPFSDPFDGDNSGTFHKFTGDPVSDRIDWILSRGLGKTTERKIITDRFAGIFPSDHFPVYAEFSLDL